MIDDWVWRFFTSPKWCKRFGHSWRYSTPRTLRCKRRCVALYFVDLDRLYEGREQWVAESSR